MSFKKLTKRLSILAVLFLLTAGAFLRFHDLGAQSYWMDEGYTVNATLALQAKGEPILDSGFEYNCAMYCTPTAIIANTFGNTPTSYRLLAAIAGTVFIIAIFFITRRLFNRNIAILSTALVTFSYIHIAWSRQARWYTLFTLFFWLALFFFYHALYYKKHSRKYYLLTAIMTVLACLTHTLGILLPFVFLAWTLIEYLRKRTRRTIKTIIVPVLIVTLILAIFTIFNDQNPILWLTAQATPHLDFPYYLMYYLREYWLFIPFIALVWLIPNSYRRPAGYLAFVFMAYLIPFTFFTDTIQYRYLFHLTPVIYILAVTGLVALSSTYTKRYQKITLTTLWIVFFVLFFTIGGGTLLPKNEYYLESDPQASYIFRVPYYAYVPQPDWNSAYSYITAQRKDGDIIISSQSVFNKIFLGEAGYWLRYSYLGTANKTMPEIDDKEYYVGAYIIDDLEELKDITKESHGFLVLDFFALDGRIQGEILDHIENTYTEVYYKETNDVSAIWVYHF